LQTAFNNAQCGDTLMLQAGATFPVNNIITISGKNCDDQHWITVRTSAPDSALPPEGTRITPCFAGVSSLPARPALSCQSTQNVMPRIVLGGNQTIKMAADHVRFVGLEITRATGGLAVASVFKMNGSKKVIFDRVWMHGTAKDELKTGVRMVDANFIAVIDSYFTDFHCLAGTGTCTDAQTISGGDNALASGTFKIVNNFLEAAGEGIIFGGGGSSYTSSDIEIRRNHFFKPMTWMPGTSNFIGTTFIVKNNFELKNAQRLLFEGNILENVWGGFSQAGFQILLTPKNQQGYAPGAVVRDITMRYNLLRHSGAGMQLAVAKSFPPTGGASSKGMFNVSIHDMVIDDVDSTSFYQTNGSGIQISNTDTAAPYHHVWIDHITFAKASNGAFDIGSVGGLTMQTMNFTNSLLDAGRYGVTKTGNGSTDCSYQKGSPKAILDACFVPYSFSTNAVSSSTATWPSGTQLLTSPTQIGYTSYLSGTTSGFRLSSTSPFKNAASDGRDLGADIDALEAAIAGVY
jgi:hypothetical protein